MVRWGRDVSLEEFSAFGKRPSGRSRWDELIGQLQPGQPHEIVLDDGEKPRGVKVQLQSAARRQGSNVRFQEADGTLYVMKDPMAEEEHATEMGVAGRRGQRGARR
jgi:hypothetical protein